MSDGPAEPDTDAAAHDLLVERLRRLAAAADPPPAHIDEAARAALSMRHLDELARLLMDSESGTPVLARGEPGEVRLLSFGVGGVSLELQVTGGRGTVSLRGLVAGGTGPVAIEGPAGRQDVETDEHGWFAVDDLPSGMTRVHLTSATGGVVTTEWVDL